MDDGAVRAVLAGDDGEPERLEPVQRGGCVAVAEVGEADRLAHRSRFAHRGSIATATSAGQGSLPLDMHKFGLGSRRRPAAPDTPILSWPAEMGKGAVDRPPVVRTL